MELENVSTTEFVNIGTCIQGLSYGDIWYTNAQGTPGSYGFVIPDKENNTTRYSFIQLSESSSYKGKINFISSSSYSGNEKVDPTYVVNNFNIMPSTGPRAATESGIFNTLNDKFSYQIEFNDNKALDRNSAIFYGDTPVPNAENIYLPSYDITKNIKAKSITVFGEISQEI